MLPAMYVLGYASGVLAIVLCGIAFLCVTCRGTPLARR